MKVCLDTNAYSSLRKGNGNLADLLEQAESVLLPTVVMGELFAGFLLGADGQNNVKELTDFLCCPGVDTVHVDEAVAEYYGWLVRRLRKKGTPLPTNDIWVAATALNAGARIVSYDKHFEHVPDLIVYAP